MNNKAFCVSDLIKHLGCWYFGRITKRTELTLFTVLRILCRIKESGWTLIREASMFYKKTLRGVRWTRTTFANLVSVFCRSQDNYLKRLHIYGSTLLFVNFAERFLENGKYVMSGLCLVTQFVLFTTSIVFIEYWKKKKTRVLWGKETFLELNIHPAITDASSCPCHLMERACYVARLNGWKRAKMSQRTCLFGIETEHKVGWISAAFKNPRHFAWLV